MLTLDALFDIDKQTNLKAFYKKIFSFHAQMKLVWVEKVSEILNYLYEI